MTSPNGTYKLTMQSDGNLVEYQGTGVIWASNTRQYRGYGSSFTLKMQGDGNCVLYSNDHSSAEWETKTLGNPSAYLALQDDGNLVVYGPTGNVLWHR